MSENKLYNKGLGRTEDAVSVIHNHEMTGQRPSGFALCDTCLHVSYSRTKYGTEIVFCSANDNDRGWVKPNRFDPIVRCVWYDEFGKLSLAMLWNIATLIDVKKTKIGFGDDTREEVDVLIEKVDSLDRLNRWHFNE